MGKSGSNDPGFDNIVEELVADLERQIHHYEENYLRVTLEFGNLVIGWNGVNLASSNNVSNRNTQDNRHSIQINESNRIFSNSSVTSTAAINSIREAEGTLNSETETACSSNENNTDTEFEKMFGLTHNGPVITRNPQAAVERSSGRMTNPSKPKKQQNH